MARFYIDQMFKPEVAELLRLSGHDALRAFETGQSRSPDEDILSFAIENGRILVTHDRGFGNWLMLPLKEHPGVIRIEPGSLKPEMVLEIILQILDTRDPEEFKNHIFIHKKGKLRRIKTA